MKNLIKTVLKILNEGSKKRIIIILLLKTKESRKTKDQNRICLNCGRGRPTHSEVKSIQKIAELGRKYNSNIYFVHIGSSAAIDAIIKEKEKGQCNLYIETCPHYLIIPMIIMI